MKTFKQKNKMQANTPKPAPVGLDEEKLKAILERTGYTLEVSSGQRKYGGPPPDWEGSQPESGCEVFCGKIPKDVYEDELVPLFEKCGRIWDLRLMMDPLTSQNRGFAFITFCDKEGAQQAVKQLDNHEVKPRRLLKVNISVPNLRLFVGDIPKTKNKEEIQREFSKFAPGLHEVIIYSSPDNKTIKNRGFCFLEYETHKAASLAKRALDSGRIIVWGRNIFVDWADPQEEPDEQTMALVKVLCVRNLTSDVTEEKLKETFEPFGKVKRIKKIKDYGFIHFDERDEALKAMEALNNKDLCGAEMQISLAKPQSESKRTHQLRGRERRMMAQYRQEAYYGRQPGRRGAMRGQPIQEYDYDYEYYGYGDYQGGYADGYGDYRGGYADGYGDYRDGYGDGYGDYGGYADPYYEAYYGRFEEYDYGSSPVVPSRGRSRGGTSGGARGRSGLSTRGRAGRSPGRGGGRGVNTSRGRGRGRGNANQKARGNLAGKRKFEGGHQNQGDSKRRVQNQNYNQSQPQQQEWGNQPIAQQPLQTSGTYGYGGGGGAAGSEAQWYQDTFRQYLA